MCLNNKSIWAVLKEISDFMQQAPSDSSQVKPLLNELSDQIEKFYGDGAYDRHQTYNAISEHQSSPVDIIIPPLESSQVPEDPKIELTQRDSM